MSGGLVEQGLQVVFVGELKEVPMAQGPPSLLVGPALHRTAPRTTPCLGLLPYIPHPQHANPRTSLAPRCLSPSPCVNATLLISYFSISLPAPFTAGASSQCTPAGSVSRVT